MNDDAAGQGPHERPVGRPVDEATDTSGPPWRVALTEVLGPNVENKMTVMSNEDPALPDDLTVLDACMTCLSDDAALLHGKNPEDEIADNMLKAEELMREMADLLAAVLGTFARDDDLPDNLLPRIHAVLYRT